MNRPVTLTAAMMLVAACGESPTAPAATPATSRMSPTSMSLSSAATPASLDFSADFANMSTRVLPSFSDAAAADRVGTGLDALAAHLAASDVAAAQADITAVRAELQPGIAAAADIGSIEHVLDMIESAL
jgi:hypothetical protein